jgi:hypothetical protein
MSSKDLQSNFDLEPAQSLLVPGQTNNMGLFSGIFDVQDKKLIPELSNVLHCYSLIPKMVNRQKATNGIVTRYFPLEFGNPEKSMLEVEVREAKVKVFKKDGSYTVKSCFPGIREERIEEVLIYMASRGGPNISVDNKTGTVGIYFTINSVKATILDLLGKDYKWIDVRDGIELLNLSNLGIKPAKGSELGGKFNISSARLKTLVWANGSSDDGAVGDTRCYAEFHPLLAFDISTAAFNLYGIGEKKKLEVQLAHVLFSRLSVYYRNASVEKSYNFDGKKFLESSYLGFNEDNPRKSWSHLKAAVNDLKDKGIISRFNENKIYCPRSSQAKVINIMVEVFATSEFQKRTMIINSVNKKLVSKHTQKSE